MKSNIFFILACLISTVSLAQNGINYKAQIKDASGEILANQNIDIQFTILKFDPTTVFEYQENHTAVATDSNGILAVSIGQGSIVFGNFSRIDWGSATYFLSVQVDTGDGLVDMGTTQFNSVPYAQYAEDSRKGTLTDAYNKGGEGAGRTIDATNGKVEIIGEGLEVKNATDNALVYADGDDNVVGIGTDNPQGALDITSSNMGVVVPRVSSIEDAVSSSGGAAVNGTILFDESRNTICFRVSDRWVCNGLDENGNATTNVIRTSLAENITYVKASNNDINDQFGYASALSDDGLYLVVGATNEDSADEGINGSQNADFNQYTFNSGAAYVYFFDGTNWLQQAYIKASNVYLGNAFGTSIAINEDGSRIAIGSPFENSDATGINGDDANINRTNSGAVYVFTRSGATWNQEAYIKASNPGVGDEFGNNVSISNNGTKIVVGAHHERSNATGVNGDQTNNAFIRAGAAYVFSRAGSTWSQEAYLKASNTNSSDFFGEKVSIDGDGSTIAIAAIDESSSATGVNGDDTDNSLNDSGAIYIFSRSGTNWSQEAYIKASNANVNDNFGASVSISDNGNRVLVGATGEDSSSSGVNLDETDNSLSNSGAVYLFDKSGTTWSQTAYIKASNPDSGDEFGSNVAISGSGTTLMISSIEESSDTAGINNGNQNHNYFSDAGAVYIFNEVNGLFWQQTDYIKASNTNVEDQFGFSVSLNSDGTRLSVGANLEDSDATGINGDLENNANSNSGAVYIIENNF